MRELVLWVGRRTKQVNQQGILCTASDTLVLLPNAQPREMATRRVGPTRALSGSRNSLLSHLLTYMGFFFPLWCLRHFLPAFLWNLSPVKCPFVYVSHNATCTLVHFILALFLHSCCSQTLRLMSHWRNNVDVLMGAGAKTHLRMVSLLTWPQRKHSKVLVACLRLHSKHRSVIFWSFQTLLFSRAIKNLKKVYQQLKRYERVQNEKCSSHPRPQPSSSPSQGQLIRPISSVSV